MVRGWRRLARLTLALRRALAFARARARPRRQLVNSWRTLDAWSRRDDTAGSLGRRAPTAAGTTLTSRMTPILRSIRSRDFGGIRFAENVCSRIGSGGRGRRLARLQCLCADDGRARPGVGPGVCRRRRDGPGRSDRRRRCGGAPWAAAEPAMTAPEQALQRAEAPARGSGREPAPGRELERVAPLVPAEEWRRAAEEARSDRRTYRPRPLGFRDGRKGRRARHRPRNRPRRRARLRSPRRRDVRGAAPGGSARPCGHSW